MALAASPALAGLPSQSTNQADALGGRTAEELARQVADGHRNALRARQFRDLTAEKHLIWIDGEGDNQRADIYQGQKVAIPRMPAEYWVQENLLRPIVDNQVAYHAGTQLAFLSLSRPDAKSRARAAMDSALINHVSREQHWNALLGTSVYLADCVGFCPLHAMWRDDTGYEAYEPLYHTPEQVSELGVTRLPRKGLIDCWVGNPFDTTFNEGAKRGSVQLMRYGRVLPAALVRERFQSDVEGTDRFTSGSVFQRILQRWYRSTGVNVHGSGAITGSGKGEEMLAVVCQETPPGIDPEWPEGRLTIVALEGASDTGGDGRRTGRPRLLADQPLPGGRFSAEHVYTSVVGDDVHGTRWIAPLADLQYELNDILSDEKRWRKRMVNAPTMYSGTLDDDQARYDGATLLQVLGDSQFTPQVLSLPAQVGPYLAAQADAKRQAMYTLGGYQAASRGEGNAADSGRKVEFLAQQDDTVHGPARTQIYNTMEQFAGLCHTLFRQNADVGWFIETLGDDYDEMAEAYVSREKVSETTPTFKLVPALGSTPERQAQMLLSMATTTCADGQPLMTSGEARQKWPDGGLFNAKSDPADAQQRRARRIAAEVRRTAEQWCEQNGFQPQGMADPNAQHAALIVVNMLNASAPLLPQDDATLCMSALAEVALDESENPVARQTAMLRWTQYQQWQAMIAQQAAEAALQAQAKATAAQHSARSASQAGQAMQPAGATGQAVADEPEPMAA